MAYVDGYVLPVPVKNLDAYKKVAKAAGRIWREHGALDYWECAGDDLDVKFGIGFPRQLKVTKGETVIFAWIVFKSKAHRDRVNAKVMKDERLAAMMEPSKELFDTKRMLYGGFKPIVHE